MVFGHVSDSPDAVEINEDGCFVDVKLSTDVDVDPITGFAVPLELTAQWLFPVIGNGIVFSKPKPGQPCLVLVDQGDPDAGCYAQAVAATLGGAIPFAVLADEESMHITPEEGQQLVLAAQGLVDITVKKAARVDDEVEVTIPTGSFLVSADNGVLNAGPVTVTGKITKGSSRVQIGGDSEV